MTILRSQKAAKREPKWSQKRSQIEAQIEAEKCSSLGPSLRRFGFVLVTIVESEIINNQLFFNLFVKIHVWEQCKVCSSILGRFVVDLGSEMEFK